MVNQTRREGRFIDSTESVMCLPVLWSSYFKTLLNYDISIIYVGGEKASLITVIKDYHMVTTLLNHMLCDFVSMRDMN